MGVSLAGRPYEVRVGSGLLTDLPAQCGKLLRKKAVPVVTDANVHALWGKTVEDSLAAGGFTARWLILPAGESTKSWANLQKLVDWLLDKNE